MGNNLKNEGNVSITNAKKARKRGLKKVFSPLTLQTYQTYIQEAFKVFEWLSMTFLALFLKTETVVMENIAHIHYTLCYILLFCFVQDPNPYLIIVADAADAVSVNLSGWCKFLQIYREKLAIYCVNWQFTM